MAIRALSGFTLAELLIALLIIAEIATFTIPKVISAQSNGRNKAIAKETMATVASAYQQLQLDSTVSYSTTAGALTPYLNYVSADTSTLIDGHPSGINLPCSVTNQCVKLHNGAVVWLQNTQFGSSSGYTYFVVDPDGARTGNLDSFKFILYYNGRLTDYGSVHGPQYTPSWFSW